MKIMIQALTLPFILALGLQANVDDSGAWDGNLPNCQNGLLQVNLNHQILDDSTIVQTLAGFAHNAWLIPKGYPQFFSGRPLIGVELEIKNLDNLEWGELKTKIESSIITLKDRSGIIVECANQL